MRDIQESAPFPEDDVGKVVGVGFEFAGVLPADDPGVDLLDKRASPGGLFFSGSIDLFICFPMARENMEPRGMGSGVSGAGADGEDDDDKGGLYS